MLSRPSRGSGPRPRKRPARVPAPPPVSVAARASGPLAAAKMVSKLPSDYRRRIYEAIAAYAGEHGGNTPTLRELCGLCQISSTSVVNHHIRAMQKEGKLERRDGKLIVVGATWIAPDAKEVRFG